MRYRAFISYSHADASPAAWLHRQLEGWRVPARMRSEFPALPEKLAPVFRDREELGSAGELGPQIQAALSESEALIVLCSPDAARSRWVEQEVRAFRTGARGERIFALIVGGEPGSGGERECFPPALRETEPLAADLRPGKDGKELALLKIIAGLLGVPLDALRQREARRRHQRQLVITSLAVVVMLVTSVLAVQAHLARKAAERRQKQAENLVNFMLGDLNDKLTEVSRLDILEGVQDHAMEYFQSLPADDVTDEALVQRAKALVQIGNVRRDQGHYPQAREAWLAAGVLTARLAKAQPANVERQLADAEVYTYVGLSWWYEGKLDDAQRNFDAAAGVLQHAQKLAPRNGELLFQLSTIDNNAAHVFEGSGRTQEAIARYQRMLSTTKELVALDGNNNEWQAQLGLAHNNLAKMALLRGDIPAALAGYQADVAIEEMLLRRDARNNAQIERVLLSRGALGRVLAFAGRLDAAATELQGAVDAAEKLHAMEPDSANLTENVPIYATSLARLRRLQGDAASAGTLVARSLQLTDELLKTSADNPGWQRLRAEALVERSQQSVSAGDRISALRDLGTARALLEPLLAQQGSDRSLVLATASAQLRAAQLAEPAQSAALLKTALATCDAQTDALRDPRLRALRVELLLALGAQDKAQAEATELWQQQYREPGFAAVLKAKAAVAMASP